MTKLPKTVGIAGGIGAGKSIVSRMLSVMGYPVYDTDARARAIMDFSDDIKAFLCREIHPDAVDACGAIDRRLVGEVVFACDEKRLKLNGAVHDAVREDLRKWVISHAGSDVVFVECAIMCESGIAEMVDAIWVVEAPEALRVDRICRRNGFEPEQAIARIQAQVGEELALAGYGAETVLNDGCAPILPRIEHLLAALQ